MHRALRRRRRAAGSAGVALLLAFLVVCGEPQASRILVVQGVSTPRLDATLAAFRATVSRPVEVLPLASSADAIQAAWTRGGRGSVLVALGPAASDRISELALPGPVVHCLAGPDAVRAGAPAVPSEVPYDQQAAWLAKLVPAAKTVALLFDPALNTRRAEAYAAAFGIAGYRTLLQPVASPAGLPAALESLTGRADVLVALRDGTVYASEASRGLLLHSFRKGIPIVATSEAWVRRGALYAVDWDYEEVGAACAALVAREAANAKAKAPAPVAPPPPRVHVNLKSAAHFGLAWSPDLMRQVVPLND